VRSDSSSVDTVDEARSIAFITIYATLSVLHNASTRGELLDCFVVGTPRDDRVGRCENRPYEYL
jgi:hypothetical protein